MKNLIPFVLRTPEALPETAVIEEALEECRYQESKIPVPVRQGWVTPLPGDEAGPLLYETQGFLLLRHRQEKRTVSAAVVKERLNRRIREIEHREGRKVSRKEKSEMKEDIVSELLPRVLPTIKHTWVAIDRFENRIVVDAGSRKYAEEVLSFLRISLDSLPIEPPSTADLPAIMTHWLTDQAPPDAFGWGSFVLLKQPGEDGATARLDKEDLLGDEVQRHLEAGKQVQALGLTSAQFSFRLDKSFALLSVRPDEALVEELLDNDAETAVAAFDHEMGILLMSQRELLNEIAVALKDG